MSWSKKDCVKANSAMRLGFNNRLPWGSIVKTAEDEFWCLLRSYDDSICLGNIVGSSGKWCETVIDDTEVEYYPLTVLAVPRDCYSVDDWLNGKYPNIPRTPVTELSGLVAANIEPRFPWDSWDYDCANAAIALGDNIVPPKGTKVRLGPDISEYMFNENLVAEEIAEEWIVDGLCYNSCEGVVISIKQIVMPDVWGMSSTYNPFHHNYKIVELPENCNVSYHHWRRLLYDFVPSGQ